MWNSNGMLTLSLTYSTFIKEELELVSLMQQLSVQKNIFKITHNYAFWPDINPIIFLPSKQLQPTHLINFELSWKITKQLKNWLLKYLITADCRLMLKYMERNQKLAELNADIGFEYSR